jgi:hypothetical protein
MLGHHKHFPDLQLYAPLENPNFSEKQKTFGSAASVALDNKQTGQQ